MTPTSPPGSPTAPLADAGASPPGLFVSSGGSGRSPTEWSLSEYRHLPQYVVDSYFRHIPAYVDRDDMVQDAFLALIDWLVAFGGDKTKKEACTVMRRAIIVGLRRQDSRRLYVPPVGYEYSRYGDPSLSEGVAEIKASINLESLSDEGRWAIRLHYLEGMQQQEVAQAMGKSKNQVKWIIQHSLDKLRRTK